jgi:hypothetical protein
MKRAALANIDTLLREPSEILERIEDEADLAPLARTLILTIAVSSAIFGAAIGAYRGGVQIVFSAVKLPLVVLLTAAIATWSLSAVRSVASKHAGSVRSDLGLVLASLAFGSLLLAAMAPLVLVAMSYESAYHEMTLAVVGCCMLAGIGGLTIFLKGLSSREGRGHLTAGAVAIAVLLAVGAQLTWTLRPYLLRPRTPNVPFVRSLEGSLADAVLRSLDSSRGIYVRDEAPLPGDE